MPLKFALSIVASSFMLFSALAVSAEEITDLGPAVGTALPHNLTVNGQVPYADLAGDNGAVIFFVRSISWCPYCKNQIINISSNAEAFEERGLSLIYVSYDAAEEQLKFKESRGLRGNFVSDPQSRIIDAFGLRNLDYDEEHFAHGAPHPAVFFVHPDGTIKAKLYEEDYLDNNRSYKNRPALDIILEKADSALLAG
ncbi:MAG: peroxiredoxin family protein [Aquisalinus sp.]|nr:peroxiredoxin family protein [Aquisalinus sp.]